MNDNEEKIYDLITSKSFDELTKAEQAFVLDNLGSKEAYAKMREANLAAMEAMAGDEPAPSELKATVMEAFDQKSKKKRGIVWWKYAAAVAILAVGAFVFWPAGNPEKVQLAENVEREKSSTEAESRNDAEETDSAPIDDSEDEIDTPDNREEQISSEAEQATIEDKMILEEIAVEEEITEEVEIEIAEEEMMAELDEPAMEEEYQLADDTPIIEKDSDEQDFDHANSLADEAAPTELPGVVQDFSADRGARQQNIVSMSESVTAKRSMTQALEQTDGIFLSQIGGPFPKAYVAY